jgi:hypothetical protein
MRTISIVIGLFGSVLPALAAEVPNKTFFSGNDTYQWCQYDKSLAQSYVGGMFDMAAHGAVAIDGMRHFGPMPNNDVEVDFAISRVVGFCKPANATLNR